MRQRLPGSNAQYCASRVKWGFCVCQGCNCPKLSMATVSLTHHMINVTAADDNLVQRCSSWFQYADQAIRLYTSSVRAAIISIKTACCVPWVPKNNKAGKCVDGKIEGQKDGGEHAGPRTYAWPAWGAGEIGRTMGPGTPPNIYDNPGSGKVLYDPIRDCANVICKNENFPDKLWGVSNN